MCTNECRSKNGNKVGTGLALSIYFFLSNIERICEKEMPNCLFIDCPDHGVSALVHPGEARLQRLPEHRFPFVDTPTSVGGRQNVYP